MKTMADWEGLDTWGPQCTAIWFSGGPSPVAADTAVTLTRKR